MFLIHLLNCGIASRSIRSDTIASTSESKSNNTLALSVGEPWLSVVPKDNPKFTNASKSPGAASDAIETSDAWEVKVAHLLLSELLTTLSNGLLTDTSVAGSS